MKKYITPSVNILSVLLQDVLSASYDKTEYNALKDNSEQDIFF
jgi:hypothetical protein